MKRKVKKLENKKKEETMKAIGENARRVLEIIKEEKKKQEKNNNGEER